MDPASLAVYGPLGMVCGLLVTAVVWVVRQWRADVERLNRELVEAHKANGETHRAQGAAIAALLERTLQGAHMQANAADAHADAMRELAGAVGRNTDALIRRGGLSGDKHTAVR